jgi:hypothetical protein
MPSTLASTSSLNSCRASGFIVLYLPTRCAIIFITVMFLCGCPKRQWTYAPPPAPPPSKDFDVHFDPNQLDPNGAPRNVDWQPQVQGRIPNPDTCNDGQPYSPFCTQDNPFQDQPDAIHEAFCFVGKVISGTPIQPFFGHADWMVAQYNGSLGWLNLADDFDYNLVLVPSVLPQGTGNEHGITTNNNRVDGDSSKPQDIEIEWDSNETDAAFPDPDNPGSAPSWWAQFKHAAHAEDAQKLASLIHQSDKNTLACGSVVGLFGLDCDHGCRSELHPVFALAIQRKEDANNNEWSILARNWGTGGYCSRYDDQLAEGSLSLVLPYTSSRPPTKVEVQDFVTTTASGPGVQCPKVYFQDGQTVLNLILPPAENQGVVAFSLKIQWPMGAQPASCTQVNTSQASAEAPASEASIPNTLRGEDYMGTLLRGTSQGRHLELERDILPATPKIQASMKRLRPMTVRVSSQTCDGPVQVIAGRPQPASAAAVHRLRIDPAKRMRDDALRTYICDQYRAKNITPPVGTQQDLNQACKGVK